MDFLDNFFSTFMNRFNWSAKWDRGKCDVLHCVVCATLSRKAASRNAKSAAQDYPLTNKSVNLSTGSLENDDASDTVSKILRTRI